MDSLIDSSMHLQTHLEIRVSYAAPARDCRRVLRVLPLRRGGQIVRREGWRALPVADFHEENRDDFGNRILQLQHRRIASEMVFELELDVETSGAPIAENSPDRVQWKMPTRTVVFTPQIQSLAREGRSLTPRERAARFAGFCRENLRYDSFSTPKPRASSQVLSARTGNCADFAHLFLSLCRASGLMARYVAGFSRSQGQMHAWAEVWSEGFWHQFDPTLGAVRAARPITHIAVAVGRDFYDCAPHTGEFCGAGAARLDLLCHTIEVSADA